MQYFLILLIEFIALFLFSKTLTIYLNSVLIKIFRKQKLVMYVLAFLFLPGTIIHELAHFISAEITRVSTGKIDIFPRPEGKYVKLGSVEIAQCDPFRRAFIGIAPFLVGMTLIGLTLYWVFAIDNLQTFWVEAVGIYLLFELSNTMFSSRRDMEGVIELFITLAFIVIVLFVIGVRPPRFIYSIQFIHYVKIAYLFILIPLGINTFVIAICGLFLRFI